MFFLLLVVAMVLSILDPKRSTRCLNSTPSSVRKYLDWKFISEYNFTELLNQSEVHIEMCSYFFSKGDPKVDEIFKHWIRKRTK